MAVSYMRTCAAYDSTVKAMGFDEIRVRYRQERRAVIRKVILRGLSGNDLEAYVKEEAGKLIPATACDAFIEDVAEDLLQMDENSLAGLGVSPDQLETWNHLQHPYQ